MKICGNSKLMHTWAHAGPKTSPTVNKINTGWLFKEQPPYVHMNWLQNLITRQINYLLRSGVPEWDADTDYLQHDFARLNEDVYRALVPNRDNKPPHSSWVKVLAGVPADFIGGVVPVGSVLAMFPGWFTNASNGGFTCGLSTHSVAALNVDLSGTGFYVADGSPCRVVGSKYYHESGRNLPNLTNDRFLMGSTMAGDVGGASYVSLDHKHTTGDYTLTPAQIPGHVHKVTVKPSGTHRHAFGPRGAELCYVTPHRIVAGHKGDGTDFWYTNYGGSHAHDTICESTGGGQPHNHGDTGMAAIGAVEVRPKFVSCFYIVRVY